MLGPELELNIAIPEQTRSELTFCHHSESDLSAWVQNLPMANIGETARKLYQAISELNQLAIQPSARAILLETLRPAIHYASSELSKHFINQKITLPEKQQKIANLTQALHLMLATGYKVVMVESLDNVSNEKVRKNFACAAHRMQSEYGRVLLTSFQLYTSAPKTIWRELHNVYSFAESIGLLKYTISDEHNVYQTESRIDQAYKRNLLLSCCNPNQLRQKEISVAYESFENWVDQVSISESKTQASVFTVDSGVDAAPRYVALASSRTVGNRYYLETKGLVQKLEVAGLDKALVDPSALVIASNISDHLRRHLASSLKEPTKRSFNRIAEQGSLELCVGLSACHYYLSGQQNFQSMLFENNAATMVGGENKFLSRAQRSEDAWAGAQDAGIGNPHAAPPAAVAIEFEEKAATAVAEYPCYEASLVNVSPGGYCLAWSGDLPENIQTGEVLAVRESSKNAWSIAVIRWIRHSKKHGVQMGIELLAPSAHPCAVQLLHRTGDPSEYLRGLLLPEIASIKQPTTLITPSLPFQVGNKVSLRHDDSETKSILESCIAATNSFTQFKISEHIAVQTAANQSEAKPSNSLGDDFDSLWPEL